MSQYSNDMSGALFKNDKGDNPKRPDYAGNCEINGHKWRIAAWIRQSKSGETFMSLKFSDPNIVAGGGLPQGTGRFSGGPQNAEAPLDDDMPF